MQTALVFAANMPVLPVGPCSGKCKRAMLQLQTLCAAKTSPQRRAVRAGAFGESDAAPGVAMTVEQAQELLRVQPGAGFESIMEAKSKMLARAEGDAQRVMQIEAAYDLLLMQSMKQRLTGEMKVKSEIRFADVPVKKTVKQVQTSMLSQLPNGNVKVALPPNDQLAPWCALFGGLMLWSFIQGATESPVAQVSDVAGLQQSLGLLAAIYFLKEKKRLNIWRAVGYSVGGLVLGSVLGGLLQSWLRVDVVPLLGMGSPGVFTAEFGILGVGAAAILLA